MVVSTIVERSPAEVWDAVRDVTTHDRWMADAEAVRLTGERRAGIGTRFEADTKIGPIRLVDRMEITEWVEGTVMGVRHVGLVTGVGRFTLAPAPGGATVFTWDERLRFPWWLGGRAGEIVGAPVLGAIWRRNLKRLKELVEAG